MNNQKLDFVLAFPGIGKTAATKHLPGLMDLDFGHLREAFGVDKAHECQLLEAYSKLIRSSAMDGLTVLINEPKVLPYLKQKRQNGIVVLPKHPFARAGEYAMRIRLRGGRGNGDFAKAMENNYAQWVASWKRLAEKYGYPVVNAEFLDEYLHKEVNHEEKGQAEDR